MPFQKRIINILLFTNSFNINKKNKITIIYQKDKREMTTRLASPLRLGGCERLAAAKPQNRLYHAPTSLQRIIIN